MRRRTFVKVVSATASAATGSQLPGRALAGGAPPASAAERFPQSVKSGDPTPTSVLLWTRVQTSARIATATYQVSRFSDFRALVAQGTYTTDAEMDHTVRIKLTGLQPGTTYYYRFAAGGAVSRTGRTRTAPSPASAAEVRFAFVSCQDYTNGYYSALGALAQEDLDFVVHLGDYVYETAGRRVREVALPDGAPLPDGGRYAATLADYRSLYRTYGSDPQLQALHEAFPVIAVWDDHEYSNDAWGATGTYFNEARDEFDAARRQAASRAWFEYQPADIPAYDGSKPYDASIRIYRAFRFGRLLDLLMTDQRLYRDEHLIPEGPPIEAIRKPANTEIGARYAVPKPYFDALEAAAPPRSMLGAAQKEWLKAQLAGSTATWKVWGSEVSLLRMQFDLARFGAAVLYFDLDQWDGYNRERRELMAYIKERRVANVVAVCGDIHGFLAGRVYEDYDDQSAPAAMVDFTGGSVSSASLYEQVYGPTTVPGFQFAPLEPVLRADPERDTNGVDALLLASNPHLVHVRSGAHGYATVLVQADALWVTFKEVGGIATPDPTIKRATTFRVPSGSAEIISLPT